MTEHTRLIEDPIAAIERRDGAVIVHLAGELDLYNAPAVRAAILALCEEEPPRVVVDLEDVTFVDSTGLGVLVEAGTKLSDRRALLLAAPGLEAHRALQISGLDQHLSIHDSVDSALDARLS